jgi:hypothetical protein
MTTRRWRVISSTMSNERAMRLSRPLTRAALSGSASVEVEELFEESSSTSALALAARFVAAAARTASLDLVEEVLVGVRA